MIKLVASDLDGTIIDKTGLIYENNFKAINDLKTKDVGEMPDYLKSPYIGYLYPHNYKSSLVKQEYLPSNLVGVKYYIPKTSSKYETSLKEVYEKIEKYKENN